MFQVPSAKHSGSRLQLNKSPSNIKSPITTKSALRTPKKGLTLRTGSSYIKKHRNTIAAADNRSSSIMLGDSSAMRESSSLLTSTKGFQLSKGDTLKQNNLEKVL